MNRLLFILILCLSACGQSKKEAASVISKDSLEIISKQWKADSLGCSRLRDPQKIRQLITQLELVGKDSSSVINYLGSPNGKNFIGSDTTVFYYFMACGMKEGAGYNFYCNFKGDKMFSTQTAILN